jgi:hypothetical protein
MSASATGLFSRLSQRRCGLATEKPGIANNRQACVWLLHPVRRGLLSSFYPVRTCRSARGRISLNQ